MKTKIKIFTLILAGVFVAIDYNSARALSTRDISMTQAQNNIDLKVWAGYGLTINFQKTGEKITQAWLADPSRIAFSTNGKLCQKAGNNLGCSNGGATVVFLRQIKALNFPSLIPSSDGGTQLVILTSGNEGQKQYQFRIIPARGTPEYASIFIKPAEAPISTIASKPNSLLGSIPVKAGLFPKTHRDSANALVAGLMVAKIEPNSNQWNKVQLAIKLLRQGKSINEASTISRIPLVQLNQLINLGQK